MSAATAWPGETAELEGVSFGSLTVEAPMGVDARGVRVLCRCSCGRVAVRLVAELASGRALACRVCGAPKPPAEVRRCAVCTQPVERRRGARGPLPRTCSPACEERDRFLRGTNRCGHCRGRGHYVSTCPQLRGAA